MYLNICSYGGGNGSGNPYLYFSLNLSTNFYLNDIGVRLCC